MSQTNVLLRSPNNILMSRQTDFTILTSQRMQHVYLLSGPTSDRSCSQTYFYPDSNINSKSLDCQTTKSNSKKKILRLSACIITPLSAASRILLQYKIVVLIPTRVDGNKVHVGLSIMYADNDHHLLHGTISASTSVFDCKIAGQLKIALLRLAKEQSPACPRILQARDGIAICIPRRI